MFLRITKKSGLNYSKLSGDFNQIHTNEKTGYNSIYGEIICHGCNILEKLINQKRIYKKLKKFNQINFLLKKFFSYENKIKILEKKNKNEYLLIQEKETKGIIKLIKNKSYQEDLKNFNFTKINIKLKNKSDKFVINKLLREVSRYVGMVFPGKNSGIDSISINYNLEFSKYFNGFYSKLIFPNGPFIKNYLIYENYIIGFNSFFRPLFKKDNTKVSKKVLHRVKKIDGNSLVIGASNGLGAETLKLLSKNNEIKIFATYFKNKIKKTQNNIYPVKADVLNDLSLIINIIKKNNIKNIYYYASPKILNKVSSEEKKLYKKIFLLTPSNIVNKFKNLDINFFYPSTIFIQDKNNNTFYKKIKLLAENNLKKIVKNNNLNLKIIRLPKLNSRQNINFFNKKYISLTSYLNNNPNIVAKLF